MSITIRDVARKAGVSPITASRAFSRTHPVTEKTRNKVFASAKELGYVPDLLARGLVHKRSRMIGVVTPELANPFFVAVIDAAQAVAQEKDYLVIINQSKRQQEIEHTNLLQLRQMRAAGILITPLAADLEHLRLLRAQGTPVVVIARRWEGGDYVTVDDYTGGYVAGEHLVRLGHCRIGFVALHEPSNTAVQARLQGFQTALREGGEECLPQWQLHVQTLSPEDGIQAADVFLELSERPTAVFLTADHLAIGFLHRLQERGVRVPEDVAVIGYDDIRYSAFLEVPLTTVALPKREMGTLAAQILFERIEAGGISNELRQVSLLPKLVVRRSCGASAARSQISESVLASGGYDAS